MTALPHCQAYYRFTALTNVTSLPHWLT